MFVTIKVIQFLAGINVRSVTLSLDNAMDWSRLTARNHMIVTLGSGRLLLPSSYWLLYPLGALPRQLNTDESDAANIERKRI